MLIVLASAYAGGSVAVAAPIGRRLGGYRPRRFDGLRVGLVLACLVAIVLALTGWLP